METPADSTQEPNTVRNEFALERYRYILQQIHALNENAHRFLAIYQTLATTLVGAALALFVGYRRWGLEPTTVRGGVIGFLALATVVAAFTIVLIIAGALSWLDYRNEECDILDEVAGPGLRERPKVGNLLRWYETYISLFIFASIAAMWVLAGYLVLPAIK
ncbi:hypothetical protein ACFCXS_26695 [Streptomyces sp. NPDC056373]|uniref:hypothetical protein n=1 Tax=Streptomyces sp. NPDC056373 TaxID=3345798 RepID=UPI0035DEA007